MNKEEVASSIAHHPKSPSPQQPPCSSAARASVLLNGRVRRVCDAIPQQKQQQSVTDESSLSLSSSKTTLEVTLESLLISHQTCSGSSYNSVAEMLNDFDLLKSKLASQLQPLLAKEHAALLADAEDVRRFIAKPKFILPTSCFYDTDEQSPSSSVSSSPVPSSVSSRPNSTRPSSAFVVTTTTTATNPHHQASSLLSSSPSPSSFSSATSVCSSALQFGNRPASETSSQDRYFLPNQSLSARSSHQHHYVGGRVVVSEATASRVLRTVMMARNQNRNEDQNDDESKNDNQVEIVTTATKKKKKIMFGIEVSDDENEDDEDTGDLF